MQRYTFFVWARARTSASASASNDVFIPSVNAPLLQFSQL